MQHGAFAAGSHVRLRNPNDPAYSLMFAERDIEPSDTLQVALAANGIVTLKPVNEEDDVWYDIPLQLPEDEIIGLKPLH